MSSIWHSFSNTSGDLTPFTNTDPFKQIEYILRKDNEPSYIYQCK